VKKTLNVIGKRKNRQGNTDKHNMNEHNMNEHSLFPTGQIGGVFNPVKRAVVHCFSFRLMTMRKIKVDGLPAMNDRELSFVIEYTKDFNPGRAAERVGFGNAIAIRLLERDNVKEAIEKILLRRLASSDIDAEWILLELADNHLLARQAGDLGVSTRVLSEMNKHKLVDGLASAKHDVNMLTPDDAAARIQRGRARLSSPGDDDEVSFL